MELPVSEVEILGKPNSRQVLRICINLKQLIDKTVPTKKGAADLTKLAKQPKVVQMTLDACGGKGNGEPGTSSRKYQSSVVFCLLVVHGWYAELMETDLNSYDTNKSRRDMCEVLASSLISHFLATPGSEKANEEHLFIDVLCAKYSVCVHDEDTRPLNALEMAVDAHAVPILVAPGFQKCIKYLWRGWIIQGGKNGTEFELSTRYSAPDFKSHFHASRLRAPKYQNYLEILVSALYLAVFTIIVNAEDKNECAGWETAFYTMTVCFVGDEVRKIWQAGGNYLRFWNYFNDTMYTLILVALGVRWCPGLVADAETTSYMLLSCVAPFMWTRLLFYLDCFQYVGVIIVVISKMMKESILFFVLLSIVVVGFLQGFLGLDTSDGETAMFSRILHAMIKSIIAGSQFPVFDNLAPPYSVYVYYVFRFLINVMLMKILSALYNNAYKETVGQSANEYLALFSAKVLRYVRAPDDNVYIPPLNALEWGLSAVLMPFEKLGEMDLEWVHFYVLQAVYSPILVIVAVTELRDSKRIQYNRLKNKSDDANEVDYEWDLQDGYKAGDDSDDDHEFHETTIRQGLKLQRIAERSDPEFQVNLNEFNKTLREGSVAAAAPAAAKKDVETDVAKLNTQIETLLQVVDALSKENKEIKAKLGL